MDSLARGSNVWIASLAWILQVRFLRQMETKISCQRVMPSMFKLFIVMAIRLGKVFQFFGICSYSSFFFLHSHTDPLGHVDFYLNGGKEQPGCLGPICSHLRSYEFLIEIFKNGKNCRSGIKFDVVSGSERKTSRMSRNVGDFFGSSGNDGSYYITENDC